MMEETSDYQPFLTSRGEVGLAEVARRQHGVVSLAQLREAGLDGGAVKWRVRRGRLHRVHRGVYALGHARITARGRLWAATLAIPGSALSHRSAAAAWDLCPVPNRLEVTTRGTSRNVEGVRVHHARTLEATTQPDGLPLTTLSRTLRDLAATEPEQRLTRLLRRAEHLRLLDTTALTSPTGTRGARRLRAALGEVAPAEGTYTRSDLEERFVELIASAELPAPAVNTVIEGYEVDFAWRRSRVIAETDGAATHLTQSAFEADRRKDAVLTAAGWRVVRFTWRQVTPDPEAVAGVLRRLLRR